MISFISFEVAQELKTAGFVQGGTSFHFYDKEGICLANTYRTGALEDSYIPSLSELIEACNGRVGKIEAPWDGCPNHWVATNHKKYGNKFYTKGDTPDEAVARLWLALREDKQI